MGIQMKQTEITKTFMMIWNLKKTFMQTYLSALRIRALMVIVYGGGGGVE